MRDLDMPALGRRCLRYRKIEKNLEGKKRKTQRTVDVGPPL